MTRRPTASILNSLANAIILLWSHFRSLHIWIVNIGQPFLGQVDAQCVQFDIFRLTFIHSNMPTSIRVSSTMCNLLPYGDVLLIPRISATSRDTTIVMRIRVLRFALSSMHSQNLGKSLAMSNFLLGPIVDCEWLRRFLPPGHQMITDAYHFTHWPRIDYETFLYLKPSEKTCYHGTMFIGWFVICEEPTSE